MKDIKNRFSETEEKTVTENCKKSQSNKQFV